MRFEPAAVAVFPVLLLVAAIYAIAIPGPFQFDDYATVAVDPGARWLTLWWRDLALHVRPLAKLSFVATHAIGEMVGNVPAAHRTVNVALHLGVIALLVALGRAVASDAVPALDSRRATIAVVAAAGLAGLHPLATEAVAYVNARSMVLGTLAVLGSALAWIRWRTSDRRRWLVVAVVCWLAGVASREAAIVAPLVWLLWEAAREREDTPAFSVSRMRSLGSGVPVVAVAVVALVALALLAHPRYSPLLEVSAGIAGTRWREPSFVGAVRYFGEALVLLRYPTIDPDPVPMTLAARVVTTAAICALTVFAWRVRRSQPWWLLGLLWTALWLGPIYALPIRHDALAERHFYPAIWGVTFPIAVGLVSRHHSPLASRLGVAVVTIALATVTLTRLADYRSEAALWEAALRSTPTKARVLNNLGFAYMEAGRWDDAVRVLATARALHPDDLLIHDNLLRAEERDAAPMQRAASR